MRKADIVPGAELYFAEGTTSTWRVAPPTKATVVDSGPFRRVSRRQGAFYFVSHLRDDAGSYVLVDLHGASTRREYVHRRHLRGLWLPMLAKTGRTEAGVELYHDGIRRIAAKPGDVDLNAVLTLAAEDPRVDDDTFAVLAQAVDGREIRGGAVSSIAEIVGPVAMGEFGQAADHYKPGLIEWALALPTLSDDEFEQVCGSAIYDSATVERFRGNWWHEHFKCDACAHEAQRRHVAAGHDEDCRGETIYGRAHARIMREHGYQPTDPGTCRCGAVAR